MTPEKTKPNSNHATGPGRSKATGKGRRSSSELAFERIGEDDVAHNYSSGYARAFPSADVAALEAHLEVGVAGLELSQTTNRFLASLHDGMTSPRYSTLRMLYFAPDHQLAQNEIASQLRTTPGNVTQLVDGLQAEGLVERVPSPTSRRVTLAHLTPKGVRVAKRLVPEMLGFMERIGSVLTREEKLQLRGLLEKFRVGVKSAADNIARANPTK